jgi:hypothetical protein
MDGKDTASADGITDGLQIISYAANEKGSQERVPGSMWDPVAVCNRQAWQEIEKQIEASKAKVASGRASCLHYHMTVNQMDTGLLAQYTCIPRWLVHLHMVPFFFKRLGKKTLNKYSQVFKISLDDLTGNKLERPVNHQGKYSIQPDD